MKVLECAFGLSAEIERSPISDSTKKALARIKSEGKTLGSPKGSKSSYSKLSGKVERVKNLLNEGKSYSAIDRMLGWID